MKAQTAPRARHHTAAYNDFIGELIHRVSRVNPDLPVIEGGRGAYVTSLMLAFAGGALAVGGVAAFASPLFAQNSFREVAPLAATMIVGGSAIGLKSWGFSQLYRPVERTAGAVAGSASAEPVPKSSGDAIQKQS